MKELATLHDDAYMKVSSGRTKEDQISRPHGISSNATTHAKLFPGITGQLHLKMFAHHTLYKCRTVYTGKCTAP